MKIPAAANLLSMTPAGGIHGAAIVSEPWNGRCRFRTTCHVAQAHWLEREAGLSREVPQRYRH